MRHGWPAHLSNRYLNRSCQWLLPARSHGDLHMSPVRIPGVPQNMSIGHSAVVGTPQTSDGSRRRKNNKAGTRPAVAKLRPSGSINPTTTHWGLNTQPNAKSDNIAAGLEVSYLERERETMRQWTPLSLEEIGTTLPEHLDGIISKDDMPSHLIFGFRILRLQQLRLNLSLATAAGSTDRKDYTYLTRVLPSKVRHTLVRFDPATLVAMELWNNAYVKHHGKPLDAYMCVPSFVWDRFASVSYNPLREEKQGIWAGSSSRAVIQSIMDSLAAELPWLEPAALETITREARRILIFLSLQTQLNRCQLRDPPLINLLNAYIKSPTTRVWLQYVKHPYFVQAFRKWNSWAHSEKGRGICSKEIVLSMPGRPSLEIFVDKLEAHLEWDRYNMRRDRSLLENLKQSVDSGRYKEYDEWWLHQLSRRKSDGKALTSDELRDLAHLETTIHERRNPQGTLTLGRGPEGQREAVERLSSQIKHNLSQRLIDSERSKPETQKLEETASDIKSPVAKGILRHDAGDTTDSVLEPINRLDQAKNDVPTLAHGLDRALFNPGVHWLQDPHSGVFNFTHTLQKIPPVESFAFEKLPDFTKSSADGELHELAKKHGKTFAASTSSTTSMLAHIYYLISGRRQIDTSIFSQRFSSMSADFTRGMKAPGSISLVYKDGIYSVDGLDPFPDSSNKNILSWLGRVMERQLTLPSDVFGKLIRTSSADTSPIDLPTDDSYQYSKTDQFILRSQLDCVDSRLPGTGVFDIKTRACVAIRLDRLNYEAASTYLIRSQYGEFESFEREYYDMARSTMIKYNFQARIGHMDGIFVAYHNTARIFGFQYLPLEEMDRRLFGNRLGGDRVFARCLRLYEKLIQEITSIYPEESVKCWFRTSGSRLKVWVNKSESDIDDPTEPLIELTLKTTNIVNGKPREGQFNNFEAKDITWNIQYEISRRSSVDTPTVRAEFSRALQQQLEIHKYILPEGVDDIEEMRSRWDAMDFGGRGASNIDDEKWSDVQKFFLRRPNPTVKTTRRLAKRGKKDLEQQNVEDGAQKVHWAPSQ
ncbi:hypothetical protein FRC02_003541 [Tulasnella sp. 418]|nr:hypothetical protein FRC02_003541 [Tulasnella sp. 418]